MDGFRCDLAGIWRVATGSEGRVGLCNLRQPEVEKTVGVDHVKRGQILSGIEQI